MSQDFDNNIPDFSKRKTALKILLFLSLISFYSSDSADLYRGAVSSSGQSYDYKLFCSFCFSVPVHHFKSGYARYDRKNKRARKGSAS